MLVLLIASLIFLTDSLESKFLSVKIPDNDYFITITTYDLVSYLMKDSLLNLIATNNIEIIISSSKQVRLADILITVNDPENYPHWKMIDLIYKDIYEGIHISKRNNQIIVHSLSFDINDSIPFSNDMSWSAQVNYHHNISIKNKNIPCIIFAGPSLSILYNITRTLFKENLGTLFFDNSSLMVKTSYSFDTFKTNDDIINSSFIQLFQTYYIEINENRQIIRSKKPIPGFITYKRARVCYINHSRPICTLKRALRLIKEALEASNKFLKISNDLNTFKSHDHCCNDCKPNNSNNNNEDEMCNGFTRLSNINPETFLEIFQNVIGELFFDLSIDAPILVLYNPSKSQVWIEYKKEIYASALSKYFKKSLENYEFDDSGNFFVNNYQVLKVEDYHGHTVNYDIGDFSRISGSPFLMDYKRVILILEGSSIHSIVRIEKTVIISNGNESDNNNDNREESLNIKKKDDKEMGKEKQEREQKINSFYWQVIKDINQWLMTCTPDQGLELSFDETSDRTIINYLRMENPILQPPRPSFISSKLYYQWEGLLFYILEPEKGPIGRKFVNSHESIMSIWKTITSASFLSIQKINGAPTFILEKIIKIERINKEFHEELLVLLLSNRPIYHIRGFRLLSEFKLEIDLVDYRDIGAFIKFASKKLKTQFTYKILNDSKFKKMSRSNHINSLIEKYPKRFNFHENLTRLKAISMLLLKPSIINPIHSNIQVIERKGNYIFAGNITVMYYQKKKLLKEFIDDHLRNVDQIMRIGKSDYHELVGCSFVFVQYAHNRETNSLYEYQEYEDRVILSFDLVNMERIDHIIRIIIDRRKKFV